MLKKRRIPSNPANDSGITVAFCHGRAMAEPRSEKLDEIYVVEVLGVPVVRTYVEVSGREKNAKTRSDNLLKSLYSKVFGRVKIMMILSLLTSLPTAAACVGILYYPPPVLQELADSFLKVYSGKPGRQADVEEFQKSLSMCQVERSTLKERLGKCLDDEMKLKASFKEEKETLERMFKDEESKLQTVNDDNRNQKQIIAKLEESHKECETRESLLRKNLTLLVERNLAVDGKLNSAEKAIKVLQGKAEEVGRVLEVKQTREQELSACTNEKNQVQRELIAAEEKISNKEKEVGQIRGKDEKCQKDRVKTESDLAVCRKEFRQAERNISELGNNLQVVKKNLLAVIEQKLAATKELEGTKLELNNCRNVSKQHELHHAELQQRMKKVEKESQKMVAKLKNNIDILEEDLANVTKEKIGITKQFDDTELKLGTCLNKKMEHEISNAELLEEVEELKKELKKC